MEQSIQAAKDRNDAGMPNSDASAKKKPRTSQPFALDSSRGLTRPVERPFALETGHGEDSVGRWPNRGLAANEHKEGDGVKGRRVKPNRPFLLFHWSPRSRRKSILRQGLCPGKLSRCGEWRPPYVCFSRSPSMAWCLSGMFQNTSSSWDLWMIWNTECKAYETLSTDGSGKPTEYRVYHRIPKRDIWYVATRKHVPRRKKRS